MAKEFFLGGAFTISRGIKVYSRYRGSRVHGQGASRATLSIRGLSEGRAGAMYGAKRTITVR